jgi:hypothetical protein
MAQNLHFNRFATDTKTMYLSGGGGATAVSCVHRNKQYEGASSNWTSSNPSILCTLTILYTIPLLPGGKCLKYFEQISQLQKALSYHTMHAVGAFWVSTVSLFSIPMMAIHSRSGNHVSSKWPLFIPNFHQFELASNRWKCRDGFCVGLCQIVNKWKRLEFYFLLSILSE